MHDLHGRASVRHLQGVPSHERVRRVRAAPRIVKFHTFSHYGTFGPSVALITSETEPLITYDAHVSVASGLDAHTAPVAKTCNVAHPRDVTSQVFTQRVRAPMR